MMDLFYQSIGFTSKYVIPRIYSASGQTAYTDFMEDFVIQSKAIQGFNSDLLSLAGDVAENHINNLSFFERRFSQKRRYITMAYQHVSDIYDSLERRFVTGGESAYFISRC